MMRRLPAVAVLITLMCASGVAQGPPRKVTYRVYALRVPGEFSKEIVDVVLQCCGDTLLPPPRAVAHTPGDVCPAEQIPCEIVKIEMSGNEYRFSSTYLPDPQRPEPNHKPISNSGRFGSSDPKTREKELISDLQTLIVCHELQHGIKDNPDAFPSICQICNPNDTGDKVAPPTTQSR